MKKVLFVRPCHDDVTSYMYYYSKILLNESKNKGFKTINKEIIIGVIEKNDPNFVCLTDMVVLQ